MKKMTVEEINNLTRSTGIGTANVVYRAIQDVIRSKDRLSISKGDLFCISGCGSLHPSGYSKFQIDGEWIRLRNDYVEHYANDILAQAPE